MNYSLVFKLYRESKGLSGRARGYLSQQGAETVEFALTVLPFLVVFLSFLIAGFIMYTEVSVAYLAREGVMYAIKRGHEADIAEDPDPQRPDAPANEKTIPSFIHKLGLLNPNDLDVAACWGITCNNNNQCGILLEGVNNIPGCSVRVTVTYTYDPPLADYIWPGDITSSSTAEGVILY